MPPSEPEAPAPAASPDTRFWVDVPGFQGSLEELLRRAQRGDVDLSRIQVAAITGPYRERLRSEDRPELREVADFLTLVARLIALKAAAVVPEAHADAAEAPEDDGETDAGRRLAEYRLFKAAAEALLSEAVEEGTRSFLGLVAPEVIPVERMRIPPERLAAAFRAVLERLAEAEPVALGAATFSVEDKVAELRDRLAAGPLRFEEVFATAGSRLEAVACFLALLELLKRGEAVVDQPQALGPITVTAGA